MSFQYSVVATTFNDSKNIQRYLIDMCSQTISPFEIVIADGGSTDNTVELIEKFSKEMPISVRVVQNGRLNIAQGYNEAIKAATSPYIGISGIGNRYAENYYEELKRPLIYTNFDVSYSPIRGYDSTSFARQYNKCLLNGDFGERVSIASNHGAIVRRKVFEELGYYYEHFIYAGEDTEFFSLIKAKGYKTVLVPEAKVFWETPESFKDFLKQIRVYTIADLQINSKKQWRIIKNRSVKLMLGILYLIVVFYIPRLNDFDSFGYLLWVLGIVILLLNKRDKLNGLKILKAYLPIFYTIKFYKLMGKQYSVNRN